MPTIDTLYPEFLSDPLAYREAETRWQAEWAKLVESADPRDQWTTPWLQTAFADGTPCLDGNPIFSAVSLPRRLGVRVLQLDPSEAGGEVASWTDFFAKGEPEQIDELVVACVLTTETLYYSLDLMRQWMRHGEKRIVTVHDRTLYQQFPGAATEISAFRAPEPDLDRSRPAAAA